MIDAPTDYSQPFPCRVEGCTGMIKPTGVGIDDEYASAYEKWQCDTCGKIEWVPPPPRSM